jgi:hypothetical protein
LGDTVGEVGGGVKCTARRWGGEGDGVGDGGAVGEACDERAGEGCRLGDEINRLTRPRTVLYDPRRIIRRRTQPSDKPPVPPPLHIPQPQCLIYDPALELLPRQRTRSGLLLALCEWIRAGNEHGVVGERAFCWWWEGIGWEGIGCGGESVVWVDWFLRGGGREGWGEEDDLVGGCVAEEREGGGVFWERC